MKELTKKPIRRPRRCSWCREKFKPSPRGREAVYCSASCRQMAYQRRRLEKSRQDDFSRALANDLAEAKQLQLRAAKARIAELENENKLLKIELATFRDPEEPRPCAAKNRKGQPCKNQALVGKPFCRDHRNYESGL